MILFKRNALIHLLLLAVVFGLLLLSGGCRNTLERIDEATTASYKPTNIYNAGDLPDNIQRVVLLPIFYEPGLEASLERMDGTLLGEISQRGLFEVVRVSRSDLNNWFGQRQFSSVSVLPVDFLPVIKSKTAADAVIFSDLTYLQPHKPIVISVRTKLVNLTNHQIMWAFDNTFDAGLPSVAVAAKRFDMAHHREAYPLNSSGSILQSPNRFFKYVSWEISKVLPNRVKN